MRERIAMGIAVLAIAVLLTLSAVFARAQNPRVAAAAPEAEAEAKAAPPLALEPLRVAASDSLRGRVVYDSVGCARCHQVAGVGSPRYPLDGVGSRRDAEALRAWTIGADALADSLPPSAFRAKRAFRALRPADLDVLILYLQSLRGR